MTNGYLGVEIFFVISGFLFSKYTLDSNKINSFNPIKVIIKKISTFYPLIIVACIISFAIGYFTMLPDDYENLSESIVATTLFANNILQAVTTKNYWNIVNTYKPLMHTWYIGVLLQIFIFVVITLWLYIKIFKNANIKYYFYALTIISLTIFLMPFFSDADKFYYFPFRIFEFSVGSLIPTIKIGKLNETKFSLYGNLSFLCLMGLIFMEVLLPNSLLVILTVIFSASVILFHAKSEFNYGISDNAYCIITFVGKESYLIYIWHQVVIAFFMYCVFQERNIYFCIATLLTTVALSALTVLFSKKISILKKIKFRLILSVVMGVVICGLSFLMYMNAGVVRNIPELDVDKNNIHRHMFAEYVEIPRSWDNDFNEADKIHILVMGNSFGRDFANILNESYLSDDIEISYIFGGDASDKNDRVSMADYVIYGSNDWKVPEWVLTNVDSSKLYIVGNKNFGNSNGIIYQKRNNDDYFQQTAELSDEFILNNNAFRGIYGSHYIDMITPMLIKENQIRIFTDNNKYISQDCSHLTQEGAQYYARILDLSFIE